MFRGWVALAVLIVTGAAGFAQRPYKPNPYSSYVVDPFLAETKITAITTDKEGKPVVGGKEWMEWEKTPDGWLLLVTKKGAKTRYLRYPVEKDGGKEVTLADKPGRGCYWRKRSFQGKWGGEIGMVLKVTYFEVQEGPHEGLTLREQKKRLVLTEKKVHHGKAAFVGDAEYWDDRNDGR